jgi:hypothetical protein
MRERPARRRALIVALAIIVTLLVVVPVGIHLLSGSPGFIGVANGATVSPDRLGGLGVTAPSGDLTDVQVLVDGRAVRTRRTRDRLLLADPALPDGSHTMTARLPEGWLPDRETSWHVTVDSTAPTISLRPSAVKNLRAPYVVHGTAAGASTVTVNDRRATLDPQGGFTLTLPAAPATVDVTALDAVGNRSTQQAAVPVRHPAMRAVHMTALAWTSATLREPILRMAKEGRIDTIELDVKDESGIVGYLSQVPLAKQLGATRNYYDARAVARQLHAEGIRLVGRIVAFHDPVLAQASWKAGKTDRVIQTTQGTPWAGSYGQYSFTNFANPDVQAYNIALATEATGLGFDDILYDYVRRPEGAIAKMRIPGIHGTPEQAISDFLAKSHAAVRAHGAFLGASVFGIAAKRPTEIAQDIPAIARNVDYISPMVYPSHWGPGEYNVAQPNSQPYDIVLRSLRDFATRVKGTDAQVMPWLQAFSLGVTYGPPQVQAQIKAARQDGDGSFLLWNAGCRYETAGLTPKP